MKNVVFLLILGSWLVSTAFGEENFSTTYYQSPVKNWSAVAYLDTRAGLENETGATGALTSTFQGFFKYNFGNGLATRLMVAAYHDYRKIERSDELYNGYLALSKKLVLSKSFTLTGDSRAYLPLSRIERENKSFRTKLYVAPKLIFNFSEYGVKRLSLSYKVIVARNFYQYETSIAGYVNTRNYITHAIGIQYGLTEKLSIEGTFLNTHRWSTYGTRKPDVFELSLDASYALNKNFNIGMGYTIGDTTFGYDGTSFNVDLLDLTKSSIYTSLSYVF